MGARLADKLTLEKPGTLLVSGNRQMLVPPQVVAELQKGVEDRLGAKAAEFLYSAGSFWAISEMRRLRASQVATDDALFDLFCQQMTILGWGAWSIEQREAEQHTVTVRVEQSPLAAAYGQSDQPVCHLLAGAIAGMAESVYPVPISCNELACAAQGASSCRFQAVGTDLAESEGWSW